jgi:DNA-binding response OmpR family regulator
MTNNAKTILIADDDKTICDMYRERLTMEGFKVIEAANGEETIELARSQHPDLILLDIMMPRLNGLDALSLLKGDEETKKIPIIILTALMTEAEKIKQLSQGYTEYIVKSETTPGEVVDKVMARLGVIK